MPYRNRSIMNRETLINEVASSTRMPKRRVSNILKVFLSEVTEALERDERVEIRQFGSFEVRVRKARMARDLHSNVEMPLRDRPMPHFIPFDTLKKTVAEQPASPEKPPEEVAVRVQIHEEEKPRDKSNDISSMLSRAEILANKGKYEQAIKQYRRILELSPGHTAVTGLLGKMLFALGSQESALRHYDRALGNDPSHMDTLVYRAELLAVMGQYEEARTDLLRALEYDPFFYAACYQLGVLHITTGAYEAAIKMLTRALDTGQSGPEVHLQLGKAYCHLDRNDEAIVHFETLLRQQPNNEQAYRFLGIIYDKSRQIDRALEMYRKSNEISLA